MKNSNVLFRICTLAAVLMLATSAATLAQLQTGNLYGTVADNQGEALPGVTVTLGGMGATRVQVTNAEGQFRFLGLSPGRYQIKAELEGFATVEYPNVSIAVGRNTSLEVTLTPAVEEVITVTSESPLLDERKISTGITVSQTELESIPSSRDPWVILQQTPGVLVDRINVGGNESGQQSTYVSPGTSTDNSVWSVDGVVITDMGAIGSSPTYYNFDSFEEMQVTTGGTDVSLATGGVTMNMVTRRGTNEWRFSGRYLLADEAWQSDLQFSESDLGFGQGEFKQGNRIVDVKDFGAEGGGPLVPDKLWIWGSYGEQEVSLLTIDDVSDFTDLESYAVKLNAQASANNSLTAFYHYGDKVKIGRDASPTRPQPTTFDQSGPTDIYKLEDTHIFNSNFYLTGMASYVGGGFQLLPQGGGIGDPTFPNVTRTPDLVWQNSFRQYQTTRPQRQYKVDGNYFFNTGTASHELRFGVGYRGIQVDSYSRWAGQDLVGLADVAFEPGVYLGFARTERNVSDEVDFTSLYVQDTLTYGNFTANVGLRYDLQEGTNISKTIRPVEVCPEGSPGCLDGGVSPSGDPGFQWESITPRLGLTYALGEERDTLLRLSYAQFADQLASGTVSLVNSQYQYGYFVWYDTNDDFQLTADEAGPFFSFYGSIDPANGGGLQIFNQIDPGLDPGITDEIVASVEHALLPEFVIGAQVTWRNYHDILESEILVDDGEGVRPHRRDDYVVGFTHGGRLPDGSTFSVPQYTLRDGVAFAGGTFTENGDREQDYLGVSLTFNKRLANRWLLRGHVTWADWQWSVPESENEDPTPTCGAATCGSQIDGNPVAIPAGTTSGSKGGVFLNSSWSFDVSGLYQIAPDRPWGFNVAGNLNGREGYAIPYLSRKNLQEGFGTRQVLVVDNVDGFRNEDVIVFNARVEKELTFGDWGLTLSVDGFNLLNESYVLQREVRLANCTAAHDAAGAPCTGGSASGVSSGDFVREIVSPRIFRLGARLNFR